jgi:hypothetical protein
MRAISEKRGQPFSPRFSFAGIYSGKTSNPAAPGNER